MSKFRTFGVIAAMTAAAAIPVVGGGLAGAQDAGDCGAGGPAVSAGSTNVGGLLGSVAPVLTQAVAPVNAPVTSPNAQSCNTNSNSIGGGGGAGGGGGVGGAVPAGAVGGAPRFAG